MYEYRPWMLKRADTICTYCGDGCQITVQTKDNELIEVNSSYGAGRNNGDLCARGFFGFHATSHPDRLTQPLIRRNGLLEATTWEEALEYVAEQITRLKVAHGADAFGGLISSRCTNEELFVFQKFMRLVIGTNNLDSSARYGQVNGGASDASRARDASLDCDVRGHRRGRCAAARRNQHHGDQSDCRTQGERSGQEAGGQASDH